MSHNRNTMGVKHQSDNRRVKNPENKNIITTKVLTIKKQEYLNGVENPPKKIKIITTKVILSKI